MAMQKGTIVNFEDNPFFPIATLFIKSGKKCDIVSCDARNTKQAMSAIFGTSSLNIIAGTSVLYNVEDGLLTWIGEA